MSQKIWEKEHDSFACDNLFNKLNLAVYFDPPCSQQRFAQNNEKKICFQSIISILKIMT